MEQQLWELNNIKNSDYTYFLKQWTEHTKEHQDDG